MHHIVVYYVEDKTGAETMRVTSENIKTPIPSAPTIDPVELLRSLRVVLSVLTADGQTHGMPLADITPNHALVRNIILDHSPRFALNFDVSQWVCPCPLRKLLRFLLQNRERS